MAVGAKLRYEVLRRDNYTCRFCGRAAPTAALVIDHIVPKGLGGQDVASNLQVLCDECNQGKSMTMPERWLVEEAQRRQHNWSQGREEPESEDDYSGMYAYMDARVELERLPTADALDAIMRIMATVHPYRPDGPELIIAASKAAREKFAAL